MVSSTTLRNAIKFIVFLLERKRGMLIADLIFFRVHSTTLGKYNTVVVGMFLCYILSPRIIERKAILQQIFMLD
jgi:hypothetical protein